MKIHARCKLSPMNDFNGKLCRTINMESDSLKNYDYYSSFELYLIYNLIT